jgi:hypothetical protein
MFTLTLAIYNPFSAGTHRHVGSKRFLFSNRAFDFSFYRTSTLIRFDTSLMLVGNHRPEFYVTLGLFGCDFEFNTYDTRHSGEIFL